MGQVQELPTSIKAKPAKTGELEVRFVRQPQFSRITGMPRPTVFRYIATGELKAYRVGRSLFIPVAEIDRFIMGDEAA